MPTADDAIRAAIEAHFLAIGKDEDVAGAIYADDDRPVPTPSSGTIPGRVDCRSTPGCETPTMAGTPRTGGSR